MHFHSRYSPDSITTIDRIIAAARRESLDFLLLTDHNTTAGRASRPPRRRARAAAGGPAGRRISHRSRRPDCGVPPRGSPFAGAGQFPRRGARQGRPGPAAASVCRPLRPRDAGRSRRPGRGVQRPRRREGEPVGGRTGGALGQTGVLGVRRPPRVQPGTDRRDGGKPGPAQGLPPARRHYAGCDRLPAAAGNVFLSQVIKVVKTRDVRRALRTLRGGPPASPDASSASGLLPRIARTLRR